MKKIIFATLLLALISTLSFSQTVTENKNFLYISGTAELVNGVCELKYTDNAFDEVYVALTPAGAYLQLYVDKKEKGLVSIKCANSLTGRFDYVFIVKKIKKTTSPEKN
jgi:type 1 fimbria pilin